MIETLQATPCGECNGSGLIEGVRPTCCGNFTPHGECRGHCCVPERTLSQCEYCYGTGETINVGAFV